MGKTSNSLVWGHLSWKAGDTQSKSSYSFYSYLITVFYNLYEQAVSFPCCFLPRQVSFWCHTRVHILETSVKCTGNRGKRNCWKNVSIGFTTPMWRKRFILFPHFPLAVCSWDFGKMFSQNSCGSNGVELSSHEEKWHVEMCHLDFLI